MRTNPVRIFLKISRGIFTFFKNFAGFLHRRYSRHWQTKLSFAATERYSLLTSFLSGLLPDMKIIAYRGWYGIKLRHTCIMIGAGLNVFLGIEALYSPLLITKLTVFITWAVSFGSNVVLIIGAVMVWRLFLMIWLLIALIIMVGIPVSIFALFIDFKYCFYVKDYSHPTDLLFIEYVFTMFFYVYCGRFVLSYFLKLCNFVERNNANIV